VENPEYKSVFKRDADLTAQISKCKGTEYYLMIHSESFYHEYRCWSNFHEHIYLETKMQGASIRLSYNNKDHCTFFFNFWWLKTLYKKKYKKNKGRHRIT